MTRHCWRHTAAVALLAWGMAASATESPVEKVIEGRFLGWGEIDAQGKLIRFEPDGQAKPPLLHAINEQLGSLRFVPAMNGQAPVAMRTYLYGDYVLEPEGENLTLRIVRAATGPKILKQVLPRPPRRMMLGLDPPSVWGRVGFAVDARGRPVDILVEVPGTGEFTGELRNAISKWRFEPEGAASGRPQIRYYQDVVMSLEGVAAPSPTACPIDTSARAKVEGQTMCLPEFKVEWQPPKQIGREIMVENPR